MLRMARGMRLRDLAESAGLPKNTIWTIETGRRQNPQAETMIPIARALNTTVEYLVTGESPKEQGR